MGFPILSSYRYYIGQRKAPEWLARDFILSYFGKRVPNAQRRYREFVEASRDFQPDVVGMSGLLTPAFDAMKETVEAIEAAGLRAKALIMIGGGQVSEKIKEYTGADAFGPVAMSGIRLAGEWTGGE